jgi:hypothetical protein
VSEPVLSPALTADLVELLAQLVVSARRRRLAERTDPLGGTSVAAKTVKSGARIPLTPSTSAGGSSR